MCAKFGDPMSRDCEVRHKKTFKKRDFLIENLLIRLSLKNYLACKAEL